MKVVFAVMCTLPLLGQQAVDTRGIEKEQALGKQMAAEIRRQSKPLDNAIANAYVKRIGSQLVSHLPETSFVYNFEALFTDAATEPMSLPGGYVLIPAAFFLSAQDEAEFANMLAHSIGHIELRHRNRTVAQGQTPNMASIPLVFLASWMGSHVDSQRRTLSTPIGFLSQQREGELEADRFGVELASRTGYDSAALRRYIERVQPADLNPKLSPLPDRRLRLARIDDLLRDAPVTPPSSGDGFLSTRKAVREALRQPEQRRAPTLER